MRLLATSVTRNGSQALTKGREKAFLLGSQPTAEA